MRRLVELAAAVALLVSVWAGFQLLRREPPPPADAQLEPPRYGLYGVSWVRLDAQGAAEFEVRATSIESFADESIRLAELEFDTHPGRAGAWHLEAQTGLAPPRERRMLLGGGVQATRTPAEGTPITLQTDQLWVDQLRRELRTELPVTIEATGRSARAVGMRADFNGESMYLLRDVHVTYAPSS